MVRPARRPGAATTSSPPRCPRPSRPRGGVRAARACSRSSAWPAATSPAPGLLDYRATGEVCGIALPAGLEDGSRLPEPIFTPATKAELGDHDENVSLRRGRGDRSAPTRAAELRDLTLDGLRPGRGDRPRARHHPGRHQARVRRRRPDGTTVLADEVLTPDSSPLLAGRRVAARPHPAVVRQADRAQLAALPGVRLGPVRPASPRRRCPTRSSSAPERGTSRPTSCSPARRSDAASRGQVESPAAARRPSTTSSTRATGRSGSRLLRSRAVEVGEPGVGQTWVDVTVPGLGRGWRPPSSSRPVAGAESGTWRGFEARCADASTGPRRLPGRADGDGVGRGLSAVHALGSLGTLACGAAATASRGGPICAGARE